MDEFRTMILPASVTPLAREIANTLSTAAQGMWSTGCAYVPPVPVRDDVRVVLHPHDHPTAWGTATYLPAWKLCVITLREYPQCLLHELRHCFEGQWHPKRDTTEDC